MSITVSEITGVLEFVRAAEQIKNVTRQAWTSEGRHESTAEHSWRLCLLALTLESYFPQVDFSRVIRICIVHDLGEAISGDIPATEQPVGQVKSDQERRDLLQLLEPLPETIQAQIVGLWDEYDAAQTLEARFAKALDKLETIIQHNQGCNPPDFDYRFNLDYGKRYTAVDPLIVRLRQIVDQETARRIQDTDIFE